MIDDGDLDNFHRGIGTALLIMLAVYAVVVPLGFWLWRVL